MQRLQIGDLHLGQAVGWNDADEADAFEALEDLAQCGAICRLLDLVVDRLAGRG
jgi:hypothetical protein